MNKTAKIILIIAGALVLICGCASVVLIGTGLWSMSEFLHWADTNTSENPQEVARVGEKRLPSSTYLMDLALLTGCISRVSPRWGTYRKAGIPIST